MKARAWLVFTLGLALLGGTAWANGRKPATNGVVVKPGDNETIVVRSTFGLLISKDAGCSFRWVCEDNIGYGGEFDPEYRITADGTIYATNFKGLRISRDGGCSFTTATAELPDGDPNKIANVNVDALDVAADGTVWVATAETGRVNDVYLSRDAGMTFAPAGRSSPTMFWKSVMSAPSAPDTVYTTGYELEPATARLFRSDNAGAMWSEKPLVGLTLGTTPHVKVLGIDPTTPERLFLASVDVDGLRGERLYRSTDGGDTFTEVLATSAPIVNLVFDGTRILIAAGTAGTFASTDGGATFAALPGAPQLACLARRPDGSLVGCGTNWEPDFKAVALSADAAAWTKTFRFVELAGPLECPAGTKQRDVCDVEQWTALRDQFAATGPTSPACAVPQPDGPEVEPPPSGGCCDAGSSPPVAGLALIALAFALRASRPPVRREATRGIKGRTSER